MDRGRYCALLKAFALTGRLAAGFCALTGTVQAQGSGSPTPSVAVPPSAPTASAPPDAARKRAAAEKAMMERRQRDLTMSEQEAQRRIDQLPPEEREAFKRNLRVWREFSPDEREVVRKAADERMRAEVEKAYQQSGLNLDKDRREVFGLRYRQERRRLERELQEKLEVERARRLPGVVDELKNEFGDRPPTATPAPSTTPTPVSRPTPSVSVPAASPR